MTFQAFNSSPLARNRRNTASQEAINEAQALTEAIRLRKLEERRAAFQAALDQVPNLT